MSVAAAAVPMRQRKTWHRELSAAPSLIPLERYARWTRENGLPFDPWIRVHARLGAELL